MKKIIIAAIAALLMLNSQAQLKVPNKIPTTDARITKAAEEKKRIDKILNTHLSKIIFRAWGGKQFNPKTGISLHLTGNNNTKFNWHGNTHGDEAQILETIHATSGAWIFPDLFKNNPNYKELDYKYFLQNGFNARLLADTKGTEEYRANFSLTFVFNDGTTVLVLFQGATIAGSEGQWLLTKKENGNSGGKNWIQKVCVKSFPGSVFPDPENPFVEPPAPR
ncbi:hypothetical protein ACTJIJ_20065 [Niabella sp. 22666]|uniref:hypothetical protein n=1 Tax=Niabella sp. 22666 TaxID=3453954 RepID=UPI003F839D32